MLHVITVDIGEIKLIFSDLIYCVKQNLKNFTVQNTKGLNKLKCFQQLFIVNSNIYFNLPLNFFSYLVVFF